jgi:hypothetical protein
MIPWIIDKKVGFYAIQWIFLLALLLIICVLSTVTWYHQSTLNSVYITLFLYLFNLDERGWGAKGSLNEELTMQCPSFYICYCTKQVQILEQACEHDLRSIFQRLYENNLIESNILKKVCMCIYKLYQWIQWLKRFDFNYFLMRNSHIIDQGGTFYNIFWM